MHWLSSLLLLGAVVGLAHPQCLTPNDNFQAVQYSTDLSGITDFGLDLYKQLSPGNSPRNFFFSPYSIWSALSLAYIGSGGDTQKQLEAALRVSGKLETFQLIKALDNLYEQRTTNNSLYTFNLANRAYVDGTLNVKQCAKTILHNELRTVNFRNIGATAKDINDFVDETTKGRITNIVSPADLVDALMVLVNAAFFKGTWKYQFKNSNTQKKDFYISAQDTAPLAMMSQKGSFRYGESVSLGARILELPYSGEDISMFLLLPRSDLPFDTRFTNMINNLNAANLQEALNPRNMAFVEVDVELPKFKFSMKLGEQLETAFKKMGIVDIFDANLADLSGFDARKDMSLKKAIHKSFIEVNEEGTEAAAATALVFLTRSGVSKAPQIVRFHCNEPFVFLIHDNQTRNVLFMGAIKNPRG
uniref:Serpin 1 n=1 Tax=Macrobrachium nipponense TaxID=159736 RepID=A0A5J6CZ86_MACNP|nr:serpin 1 [Macrobrachium nipponense]